MLFVVIMSPQFGLVLVVYPTAGLWGCEKQGGTIAHCIPCSHVLQRTCRVGSASKAASTRSTVGEIFTTNGNPWLMFVSCSVSCRCRYQPSRWACLLTTCLRSVRPHPTCPAMMACGTACAPQRDRPAGTSRRCTRRQGTPASILCKHTDGQLRHCAAGLLSAQLHRVC